MVSTKPPGAAGVKAGLWTIAAVLVLIGLARLSSSPGNTDLDPLELDPAPPSVVYDEALLLHPVGVEAVDVEVNGVTLRRTFAKGDALAVWVPLPEIRRYEIVVTGLALNGQGIFSPVRRVDVSVLRQGDPPSPPVILATRAASEPDVVIVAGTSDPCTTIVVEGGAIEPWSDDSRLSCGRLTEIDHPYAQASDVGRFEIAVRIGPGMDPHLAFRARNAQGELSDSTRTFSRTQAAAFQADDGTSALQMDTKVQFDLGTQGAEVTYTVTANPTRPEIADYFEGRLPLEESLAGVFGSLTLGPYRDDAGCPNGTFLAPLEPLITVDQSVVLVVNQELPDVVTILNGLDPRPHLTFCFSRGVPPLGDSAQFDLSVRGYRVTATTPAPTRVVRDGDLPTYSWDGIGANEPISIELERDSLGMLGLLPQLNLGQVTGPNQWLSLVSSFLWTVVRALPILLGTMVLTTLGGPKLPVSALSPARAILLVGATLIALPFVEQLANAAEALPVDDLARPLVTGDRAIEGTFLLGNVLAQVAVAVVFALGWLGTRRRWRVASLFVLPMVIAATFASVNLAIASALRFFLSEDQPPQDFPIYAGWVGAIVLTIVLLHAAFALARIVDARMTPGTKIAVVVAIIAVGVQLALPRSTVGSPEQQGPIAAYQATIHSLLAFVTFGYPMLAVLALALIALRGWGEGQWPELVLRARRPGLSSKGFAERARNAMWRDEDGNLTSQGQLLVIGLFVFAGYVVGNAGVIFGLLPISFLAAAAAYRWIIIAPVRRTVVLAVHAAAIRRSRTRGLRSILDRRDKASEEEGEPARDQVGSLMALGPYPTIGANARFGMLVGAVLSVIWLPLSLPGLAPLHSDDPYLWARLIVVLTVFASRWVIVGFFFGTLYEYLRGATGIRKALWVGLTIVAITAPFDILAALANDRPLWVVPYEAILTLASVTAIGVAFDIRTIMQAGRAGDPFTGLRNALRLSGLGSRIAGGAAFLAPVGVAVLAILQSQLAQLVTTLVSPFLPIPVIQSP